nr:outer membrane protein assembly factor BamA [Tropicibacter naphthalenivorans]
MATGAGIGMLPQIAHAQAYSFSNVSIEGNQRVEAGTILSYAGIARGQTVSAGELNDAYQRLVASGLFEQVEIIPQGGTLVIKVVEYPTINQIAFEGNKRIKDEDLAAIVQSQSRRVFSPRVAEADAQQISQAYVQQGRVAARVSPKVIRRRDNRVDLVFEVFEGGVSEIERIGFTGNAAFSDRRLRRVIETKQAGLLRAIIKKDNFIEDRIEFDKQLLRDFYSARGYVDFRITGTNGEIAQERDGYFVNFTVEEGQQFSVGEVTVTSDLPEVDPEIFEKAVRLRSGKVYSPSLVENEIARLERLAIREGLNFVRVDPRINRNDRDLTLDVEFQLTRGPRIFVERIDIEGNTTTMDQVVRRQFEVAEGDPFNPRAIRESAERIRALGFFTNADVQAREGSTPQQVVIDVNVEEAPTGSISFGGSYSTTAGFGLALSFSERNFLGRGQYLSLGINTSSDTKRYFLSFAEPAFLGRELTFATNLSYTESTEISDEYDAENGAFGLSLEFPVSENGRLGVNYKLGYSNLVDPDGTGSYGGIVANEIAMGEIFDSSLGYKYTYDTRRTGLDTTAGVLFEFGQDFGGLGGDRNFVRTQAKIVAQKKVMNEEVTLRATLQGGALNYTKGQTRVGDRFFTDPDIMRGFAFGGIGPREIGAGVNDSLGGEYYATARFEAEFPVGLPEEYGIRGGVFYDIGSVWGLSDTSGVAAGNQIVSEAFEDRQTIGVSILWDSVLGPLRMDFTEPLKKKPYDETQSFNLSVSTEF